MLSKKLLMRRGVSLPAASTGLVAVQNGNDVDLTWTDNATNETEYRIYRSSDGVTYSLIDTIAADSVSYTDTAPGSAIWYYKVASANDSGEALSGEASLQVYILRDLFTTDRAAGAVNGTAAEPGPGTRSASDSGSNLVISGNKAVANGIVGAGDPRFGYSDTITRVAGRTIKYIVKYVSSRSHSGVALSATPTAPGYGIYEPTGVLTVILPASTGYVPFTTGVDYTLWITLFSPAGAAIWVQGGAYTSPELLIVSSQYSTSPVYLFPIIARAIACAIEISAVEITDQSTLATRELLATVYQATPSHGVNYTTTADALHSLHFTLPGSPSGGEVIGIHYRQSDASNYWYAYVERNVGNTAWDFKLDLITAGTPANQITVTGVGTPDEIFVITDGNDHWCFTGASAALTMRGAKQTSASFATATEVGAWFDAGTVSLLESFAREWSL